jgi:hypothetical protein
VHKPAKRKRKGTTTTVAHKHRASSKSPRAGARPGFTG